MLQMSDPNEHEEQPEESEEPRPGTSGRSARDKILSNGEKEKHQSHVEFEVEVQSPVWKYGVELPNGDAQCKICGKQVHTKKGNTTTNLKHHILFKHKDLKDSDDELLQLEKIDQLKEKLDLELIDEMLLELETKLAEELMRDVEELMAEDAEACEDNLLY